MNNLSELIKECKPLTEVKTVNYEVLAMATRLGDMGFDYLAQEMRDRVLLAQKLEEVKTEKYPVVTPAKIKKFLEKQAAEYNESIMKTYSQGLNKKSAGTAIEWPASFGVTRLGFMPQQDWFTTSQATFTNTFNMPDVASAVGRIRFSSLTNDFLSPMQDRVAGFAWEEVPVKEYKAIPPDGALEALKKARAKEIFHDFAIASVTHVKDPLLLGILNGLEDRFYLAAWGEDVALDDVI